MLAKMEFGLDTYAGQDGIPCFSPSFFYLSKKIMIASIIITINII